MGTQLRERDGLFYAVSAGIVLVIGITWYVARSMVRRSEGREVQAILKRTNAATPENYRRQARNWVDHLARRDGLQPDERKTAEDIYARAFEDRMTVWVNSQLANDGDSAVKAKQAASWQRFDAEYRDLLAKRPAPDGKD